MFPLILPEVILKAENFFMNCLIGHFYRPPVLVHYPHPERFSIRKTSRYHLIGNALLVSTAKLL